MRAGTHPKALRSLPTGAAGNCLSTRVSRVSRLCPVFRPQPGAYPPEAPKPDVAPPCGSFGESGKHRASTRGKQPLRPEHSKGQNREILNATAEKQDKATGACALRGGHICPRCGQFWGFARAFQKARKSTGGRCRMKKARRFRENDGVPTKFTR